MKASGASQTHTSLWQDDHPAAPPPVIGPNAILQLGTTFDEHGRSRDFSDLLTAAGLSHYLTARPTEMVPENEVIRLHRALSRHFATECCALAEEAGARTADYLLANRIPQAVQPLLKALPARFSSTALLAAVAKHSWTFAGSATLHRKGTWPVELILSGGKMGKAMGEIPSLPAYYSGTFERLFRVLVTPKASARASTPLPQGMSLLLFAA